MPIEVLDGRRRDDVNAVAGLHEQFLADSPIVGLGGRFLREMFYGRLVEDGAVGVIICRHEGRIVGFASYTPDPGGFMGKGIRRHFPALCGIMARSVMARPSTLKGVWRALTIVRERGAEASRREAGLGEVISLVAVPEYQKIVPEGGKSRLTVRLFEEMIARFRAMRYQRVHLLVLPRNRASNILCSVMGCQFEKISVAGVPTHRYTFVLDAPASSAPPAS
ncbi:MAG TPA: hypothetical protein VFV78_03235 [Vicinamibacterales bacterium]|nr:hypothetical protein [Vicinamibacterales bacterium]